MTEHRVTKSVSWCMAHRLPCHDGKCHNLHGHDYILEVTLSGNELQIEGTSSGMLIDFKNLKEILNDRIVDVLDHGCMISTNDHVMMNFFIKNPDMKHTIVSVSPTAEAIAEWCYYRLEGEFPQTIVKIRIYESPDSWADYIPEKLSNCC